MWRRAGLLVAGLLPSSCVVGAERPPSRLDLARSPTESHAGCSSDRSDERPPRPSSNALWLDGYCHYDGIRYVWQPGHWERR